MVAPEMKGSAVTGPRDGNGQSVAIEFSAGGSWAWAYENLVVQTQEQHQYVEWVTARMSGSFRFMNVPVMSEWLLPLPKVNGVQRLQYSGLFDPDGSMIDGATGERASISAAFVDAAPLNAGRVRLLVRGAVEPIRHTLWFSVYHAQKGWRAYKAWDLSGGANGIYDLAITPPLRQSVAAGEAVELVRPRMVARFPVGFTAPRKVAGFWRSTPTLQFEEAV